MMEPKPIIAFGEQSSCEHERAVLGFEVWQIAKNPETYVVLEFGDYWNPELENHRFFDTLPKAIAYVTSYAEQLGRWAGNRQMTPVSCTPLEDIEGFPVMGEREPCSLCSRPTEHEKGGVRAQWYLCPDCTGSAEAERSGYTHHK